MFIGHVLHLNDCQLAFTDKLIDAKSVLGVKHPVNMWANMCYIEESLEIKSVRLLPEHDM